MDLERDRQMQNTLDELKAAVRLLIQGAQAELTARHAVEQPLAGHKVLEAVFEELDDHVDAPEVLGKSYIQAIHDNR